ncbi:hypothetical protein AB0C12_42840 [Actinoplanes sp. NPDC048967]|uniref:hypothetical protein n=1 Tax=Actinoplanes sp. NPDC048967 TaxID=3155269 RepID=UPI003411A9A9
MTVTEIEVQVEDADAAVRFYTAIFAGVESGRECLCDGRLLHADIEIGDYLLSVGTPWSPAGPAGRGHSEVRLPGDELERVLRRFAEAGAQLERIDGGAEVGDIFGHRWRIVRAG